jgi:hypothetical protein
VKDFFIAVTAASAAIAIVFGLSLLLGLGVTLAWNMCVPALFGLPECRFFEGVGLTLLAATLSSCFRLTVTK